MHNIGVHNCLHGMPILGIQHDGNTDAAVSNSGKRQFCSGIHIERGLSSNESAITIQNLLTDRCILSANCLHVT